MTMLLLLCVSAALAHVTFFDAASARAGQDVFYELNVPHSSTDAFVTHILEVTFPHGIRSAKPRNIPGWNTTIEERDLSPDEQYVSHGTLVTKTVAKITYSAYTPNDALINDESQPFAVSIQLGCNFTDPVSNSFWQSTYALWFPVRQFLAPIGTLQTSSITEWTGTRSENEVWALAMPNPSPYLLISNWSSCPAFTWLGVSVPQIPPAAAANYVLATELQSKLNAGLDDVYARSGADLGASVDSLNARLTTAQNTATAAVVLAVFAILGLIAAVIGIFLTLKKMGTVPVKV